MAVGGCMHRSAARLSTPAVLTDACGRAAATAHTRLVQYREIGPCWLAIKVRQAACMQRRRGFPASGRPVAAMMALGKDGVLTVW